jgi:hypothetical protein
MLIPNAAYYADAMTEKTMDFSDLRHATKEEADAALAVLPSASMFELEVMVRVR